MFNLCQASPTKNRTKNGQEIKLRHLALSDGHAQVKLALWRDHATTTQFEEGSILQLRNVARATFNDQKILQTTATTQIEVNIVKEK